MNASKPFDLKRTSVGSGDAHKGKAFVGVRYITDTSSRHEVWLAGRLGSPVTGAGAPAIKPVKGGPFGGHQPIRAMTAADELGISVFLCPFRSMRRHVDIGLQCIWTLRRTVGIYGRAAIDFIFHLNFTGVNSSDEEMLRLG